MSSFQSPCRQTLDRILREAGAFSYGVAEADAVADDSKSHYRRWIEEGRHASMSWLERHTALRDDPRKLLDDARSVIVCAFPYPKPQDVADGCLKFASYALGDDYHDVIRKRLKEAARQIEEKFGGKTRVCVDTAPLRERYWAVRAGVGFIARNCQLAIPGAGTRFFLGTILSTIAFPVDRPIANHCPECGRCVEACPGKALSKDGISSLDANRCRSYLTIEHRDPFPVGLELGEDIYGCDICQNVCPLNIATIEHLPEFHPREELLSFSRERLQNMTEDEYKSFFRKSAIRRASLAMLWRNAGLDRPETGK
ncbi:MAG: tRNA epoxyqueuosine(34) reductase QueG [Paramuribaculum sp.]|nr:tRNA epoxyqueuosine(34) reductase QueG [Paramuribaculum sp.]